MDELEDLQTDRINIYFYIFTAMEAESEGWDPVKDSLSPLPPPHTHTEIHARPRVIHY